MGKNRLEAFSDGVIAIIITIMVLELKVPHHADWAALKELLPVFSSYILSFIFIAIYWNNHHHLIYTVERVTGGIMWANMHLLFWLSLIPFATGWMGENGYSTLPVALYGIFLFMSGVAYAILQVTIIRAHGKSSRLAKAVGSRFKETASTVLYFSAIVIAFFETRVSEVIYVIVALIWLIPDRRIEKSLEG
jgi:uncharacterized membrane protein